MPDFSFIDCFALGSFRVTSLSGKQSLLFEDSLQFGPSELNPRTGDITPINHRKHWFWVWYPRWVRADRPTVGKPMSSPIGDIYTALMPLPEEK